MDPQFSDHPDVRTALHAIQAIVDGSAAKDLENARLDFKEEPGGRAADGQPTGTPGDLRKTADVVAEEACCLSNSEGGLIVLGVADKVSGPSALLGTRLDAEALREAIWQATTPRLSADVHSYTGHGPRLLLILARRGYQLHHARRGQYRHRIGSQCVPMAPDEQRRWIEARTGYDWSGEHSGRRIDDVAPAAIEQARDYLRATADASRLELAEAPVHELLRRLGVATLDGALTNAGALLFCRSDQIGIDYQRRGSSGASSTDRVELTPPLLPAFATLKARIDAVNDERHVQLASGVQPRIRLIPDRALREALVNAICHRDYRTPDPISVEFIRTRLVVSSPGGFPPGITSDNIISERSHPRNASLTRVFRSLRLAEQEGVGVDRMFRDMIGAGHDLPEIADRNGRVRCVLTGGEPQAAIVAVMDGLPVEARDDVDLALTLHTLLRQPTIRADDLAPILQKTDSEAVAALELGRRVGLLEPASGGTRALPAVRLSQATRQSLRTLLPYLTTASADAEEFVVRHLMTHDAIRTSEVAEMLDVTTVQASRILNDLRDSQVLQFGAASRGRNASSMRGPAFRDAQQRHGLGR